jgi:hypothetical protein
VNGALARRAALVFAVAAPGASAHAQDVELIPEVTVQMTGLHYAPTDDAFVWDGWIGAGAGLVRINRTTAYFTADVETVIGREKRTFDANQAAYHLEAGARIAVGRHVIDPFFHHVSRHVVDRPKTDAVDWNIVGLRAAGPLPGALPVSGRYAASVGHTVQWSKVGYQWEVTALVELDLVSRPWGRAYVLANARAVTVKDVPGYPRGGFVDFIGEGGFSFPRGGRNLALFAAYEHRNDVPVEGPGVKDRALIGLHVGFAPGGSAGPNLPTAWPGTPR